jgi:hypothetical protein
VHADCPDPALAPGAHGRQPGEPASAANVPGAHGTHATLPASGAEVPGAHTAHVVSLVTVQAAVWIEPGAQTVHASQLPAARKLPAEHVVHALGPAPEQVAQLGSHATHCVSAVGVHAAVSYVPGEQVSHVGQLVPLRYRPAAHARHWLALTPVQLVHDGSQGGRSARTSGTSSTRMNVYPSAWSFGRMYCSIASVLPFAQE